MATQAEIREDNECYLAALHSPQHRKEAADMAGSYTARQVREHSWCRKLIEPKEVSDSKINRFAHTDLPSVTFDMEPDVQLAAGVPFNGQPPDVYLQCDRYYVVGHRVITPRVSFESMQMRTYDYDVKQIFANNMIRDALAFEDTACVHAINTLMGGSAGVTLPGSGFAQWTTMPGGIKRSSVMEGTLQTLQYRYHIPTATCVTNAYTLGQFAKWGRDETGGDMAEDTLKNAYWSQAKIFNKDWLGSIKSELIPNFRIYHFGPKDFLGRSILFDPAKMHIEEKYWTYMFFIEYVIGTTWAHPGAIAIVDHTT